MKISRILLAAALAVAFVSATFATDREQYSVGELTIEGGIKAPTGDTLWISNAVLPAAASTAAVLTDPVINGRAAVLSSSATAERTIESGTATNGQIIVFTTPFTGNPQVSVDYTTMVATNTPAGKSGLTPTGFVAVGTATLGLDWSAIGTK